MSACRWAKVSRWGLALALPAGCTSVLDTGIVIGESGDEGTTTVASPSEDSTTADSAMTTAASTTGTDAATTGGPDPQTGTTSGGTTGHDDDTTSTGELPDDTGESDGGPGPVGSPCGFEQQVCMLLEVGDEPVGDCGGTVEIKGIVEPLGGGRFSLQDCGACELCGGPTYEIEIFAPDAWIPETLPLCSRIAVDFADDLAEPYACAFLGATVWEDNGLGEDPSPAWVAASITTDAPTTAAGIEVSAENVDADDCDERDCCVVDPGSYALTFEGSAIDRPFVLEENEEEADVGAFATTYDFWVERAHSHKECDRIPHFDWVARRQ